MPIYFAYGSNLDQTAMRRRCPAAVPIGLGQCRGFDFFIMAQGYASVRPVPAALVHGLLWSVPDCDLPALDAYEEVATGLYARGVVTIERADGSRVDALIYFGGSAQAGTARLGYMEQVIAAATLAGLPDRYCEQLRRWLPPRRGSHVA